jgi:hypothetical protein
MLKLINIEAKRTGSIVILYLKSRKKRTFVFFKNDWQKTKVFDSELSKFCHYYWCISWPTTGINKSEKHCTLFYLRFFNFFIFNNCSGGTHPVSSSIVKRPYRYCEDFGRDPPAICRLQKGFFHNYNFETVLPVSKTIAVGNLTVLIQFVLSPIVCFAA